MSENESKKSLPTVNINELAMTAQKDLDACRQQVWRLGEELKDAERRKAVAIGRMQMLEEIARLKPPTDSE